MNETLYDDLMPQIRTDIMTDSSMSENGNTLLTLTIPPRAKYNNTIIQCFNPEVEGNTSEMVLFKVQGDCT